MVLLDYWIVVFLLYLGGVIHGALDIWSEDDVFPLTRAERREMWWFTWTWPLSMLLSLFDDDKRN